MTSAACSCVKRLVLDVDRLLDVLAGQHVLDEAGGQLTEERVALDDEVDLAVDERLHAVLDRVDRDDLDVLAGNDAGGLDRLDRAERHVVVVRVDAGRCRRRRTSGGSPP